MKKGKRRDKDRDEEGREDGQRKGGGTEEGAGLTKREWVQARQDT